MAKLDQLNLRPDEGPGKPPRLSEDDQRRCDMFVIEAEMLLDDSRWSFAWDTVTSMRDRVKAGALPTDKMWQALSNIKEGGRRHAAQEKRWNRRYEGR